MKRVLFIFLLVFLTISCKSPNYVKFLKSKLKIEHVFSIPSKAYGPGSVLLFTEESGYTRICYPESVLNITRDEYEKNSLNSFETPEIKNVSKQEIKISLSSEDKMKVGLEYSKITVCKIEMKNGKLYELISKYPISKILKNLKSDDLSNKADIEARLKSNPTGKAYLALTTYGYDIDFKINVDNVWKSSAEIPQNVLKVIVPKVGIGISNFSEMTLSGKDIFVGFNGDPVAYSGTMEQIGKSLSINAAVVDVTELFKK